MRNRKIKVDKIVIERAVLHAIGQIEEMFGFATIAQIADYMQVSKPTAIKLMRKFERIGQVVMIKSGRTRNSSIWTITLSKDNPSIWQRFKSGAYMQSYDAFNMSKWYAHE